jgi:hypothetical protein
VAYQHSRHWIRNSLYRLKQINRAKVYTPFTTAKIQLRIYKDHGYLDTRARMEILADRKRFCPIRTRDLFNKPDRCRPLATLHRDYFPRFSQQHVGDYQESYVDGLYFQHEFRGDIVLWILLFSVCLSALAIFVFVYWWITRGDLVGSSNIASLIVAFGMMWLGIAFWLPSPLVRS